MLATSGDVWIFVAVCAVVVVCAVIRIAGRRPRQEEETDSYDNANSENKQQVGSSLSAIDPLEEPEGDTIIAVRRRAPSQPAEESAVISDDGAVTRIPTANPQPQKVHQLHVMAKAGQSFRGYELLQALLSQGLRFGEMSIFHRYQQTNGKGPVLFSLTSAVEPGTFDIHNMGTFASPGLILFMKTTHQRNIDRERFEVMHKTAQALARELDGLCLDQAKQLLSEGELEAYKEQLFGARIERNTA